MKRLIIGLCSLGAVAFGQQSGSQPISVPAQSLYVQSITAPPRPLPPQI